MSARNVTAAFDCLTVLELDANSRAHLIVAEGFQLVIDIKRYPFHQLHNPTLADFSIYELSDTRFAFQNGDGHTKGNAELSFQSCLRHGINQSIGDIGIGPDVDGFDSVGPEVVFLDQVEDQVLRRMG